MAKAMVMATAAASLPLLKFVRVGRWRKDGEGKTRERGGVWARNANYSYGKRAAPLDYKEGFRKLKEGLRKA